MKKHLQNHFPNAKIQSLTLQPEPALPEEKVKGLDDWDSVLKLVQKVFLNLEIAGNPKEDKVYVSHQASTPAISSAVQFAALAKFGSCVRFLVSNENTATSASVLNSSEYLKGIRKIEAQRLLERNDYAGVKDLLKDSLNDERIRGLLEAAIQWNRSEFGAFIDELRKLVSNGPIDDLSKMVTERSQNWQWWIAYEEAYLAVIRKNQGNIVEAFFHSFRAFEGVFAAWGHHEFRDHINDETKDTPCLNHSVLEDPKDYFSAQKCNKVSGIKEIKEILEAQKAEELAKEKGETESNVTPEKKEPSKKKKEEVDLDFATLAKLFRSCHQEYKKECQDLKIFWENDKAKNVSKKRNLIVHQIEGMSEDKLWTHWGTSNQKEWEEKLLKLLNFIARGNLSEQSDLKTASLMLAVHQELEEAIALL